MVLSAGTSGWSLMKIDFIGPSINIETLGNINQLYLQPRKLACYK
jgi:hypothetical protein